MPTNHANPPSAQTIRPRQVTPEERNKAKGLAYGVLYGMGAARLGHSLGIAEAAARQLQADFADTFPVLRDWLEGVRKGLTPDCTFIEMLSGRKRYFPQLSAGRLNSNLRGAIERAGVNSICQGSAADVVKRVMVRLHRELPALFGPGAVRMVLQIHDELVFEIDAPLLQPAARAIRRIMEAAAGDWGLRVELPVSIRVGPSWGELCLYDDARGALAASQPGAGGAGEEEDGDGAGDDGEDASVVPDFDD
jgi:DNA polymerase I-like protein with 3'-5' exonuclease and polymerase domains